MTSDRDIIREIDELVEEEHALERRSSEEGVPLDDDLVAVAHQLVHPGGGDGDPVLVVLDLARDADLHDYQRPSSPGIDLVVDARPRFPRRGGV